MTEQSPFDKLLPQRPRPNAPSAARIRWIREMLRPYAEDLTACYMFGDEGYSTHSYQTEICLAAIGFGKQIEASPQENCIAYKAEWHRGCERARGFLNALRRRIWPLGKMRAPGERILAEAEAVCREFDMVIPGEVLIAEVRRIAHAAAPRKRLRYAKRFAA